MGRWKDVEAAVPELAERVRSVMEVGKHKTMATLRRDGAPRISGTEAQFKEGDIWLGSMPGAVKAQDLRRDPRMALHSPSETPDEDDPGSWSGDAKIAGRAEEITDPEILRRMGGEPGQESHLFRIDITEVVHTFVDADGEHLVIEMWHEGKGHRRVKRQ